MPSPAPRMTHLGLEDMVLLPEVVHDPKDAEWPSKAQEVSQDAECAAEDQASPKRMAESLPDGPGTLQALCVFPLPRESHSLVRLGVGSAMERPSSLVPLDPAASGNPGVTLSVGWQTSVGNHGVNRS